MKKNSYHNILLVLIIFLGLYFRIIGINKPFGLGYDESITYIYSIKTFPFGIIKNLVKTDVHMPLYFLALNLWIKLFGSSDIIIRLLSVLFAELSILFGYLAGKEFHDKKTGLVCSSLIAINSLWIYYSQEVRFYSLLIMLSTVTLWLFIKAINNPSNKNFCFLIFSSLLLIYTNTISIIFIAVIFFELILFLILKKNKRALKNLILAIIIGQIFLIPFYWLIHQIITHRGSAFPDVLYFDNQVIFSLIQNWFSPILVGLYNNPANYCLLLFKNITVESVIFIFLPIIISLFIIFKNNFKELKNILTLSTILIFIAIELVESYLNRFTILSRYTLFVLPFIIVLIANGVNNFKNKKIANSLLAVLIIINLFYLLFYNESAPKMTRISGQKIPALILKKHNIGKNDIIIFPIRENLSDKYYQNNAQKFKMIQIFAQIYPKINPEENSYKYYKKIFLDNNSNKFDLYFNNEINEKLKTNSKLAIIVQKDFMPYNQTSFNYILKNNTIYENQPLLFMKLYKITDELIKNCSKLKIEKVYNIENWLIIIYKKTGEK